MRTKITLLFLTIIAAIASVVIFSNDHREVESLRLQHVAYLKNHTFNETLKLSKGERRKLGIPPNKYFEEQYLLEMNPRTGLTEFEKKFMLQEQLQQQVSLKNVPGSDNNTWQERGPNNVPGRTRAMLFDPNDPTGRRVFAGGVSGGLWVNNNVTNTASSWTRVGISENLAVSSITVDPNNSLIMYLGTGESYVQGRVTGNGIWKSTNGGTSWEHIFGGPAGVSSFNGGSQVQINSPGSISKTLVAVRAGFGPALVSDITGDLVLVDDGSAFPNQGCNALTNGAQVNGNIAIVERGSCNFTEKVINAQNSGALGVVVVNNISGFPFAMGGSDPAITIPSVMISKADGEDILATLQNESVNVTLSDTNTGNGTGLPAVPGIFHINDIVARNDGGNTEIYAAVADAIYREGPGGLLGGGDYGLYKSTNGGTSWTFVNLPNTPSGNRQAPNDIEIASDNTVWVATTNSSSFGSGGGTIFSSSNGTTFTQKHVIPNASRTEIEISETNPDKIYALAQSNPVTLLRTSDGFASVENLALPEDADNGIPANDFTRGQAFYDLMLEADPTNDDIIYVGGIDVFRSTTGGVGTPQTAWTQISKWSNNANLNTLTVPFVHADIHEMSFDPSNPDKAIIATDGGVYYATSLASSGTSTSTITSLGTNYNTTQFYWSEIGQNADNDQFISGSQDNGSIFTNVIPGLSSTTEISGGDGGYCFIDKDGAYLITSFTNNNFTRFNLPNTNLATAIVRDDDTGSFINPADLDDNLDILYTNGSGTNLQISKFTDLLTTNPVREDFTDILLTATPTALKVSPFTTGSTTLFVGTSGGSLLKITAANTTPSWADITGSEFLGSISAISFGSNENEIFITFHNYGVESIWYTTDGGVNWQNKEGDFPDIPVKAILMNPLLNNEVIIGTDLGIWRTANFDDPNPSWVQSQNGMQNVKVTSLDLRISDNTVLAATYGRGLFTGKFTAAPLSVQEISPQDDRITLYPNPSSGTLNISTTLDFGASNITVFDQNGRRVFSQKNMISERANLNVSNLRSGVYILRIDSENYVYNKKFIVE